MEPVASQVSVGGSHTSADPNALPPLPTAAADPEALGEAVAVLARSAVA
ncbi:hypothetical protein OHA79_00640 [Streptomyces sp. NBC_00841]|nr:hypothetical protein [Streptomyces sp. NBC_00841]WRZ96605.1 hypothetical protein OHA79_00640 [Streptomyces sp. NBC_00841]